MFATPVKPSVPQIVWSGVLPEDKLEQATTLETLVRAGAMSVETAVRKAQPELDEEQVQIETQKILSEKGLITDVVAYPTPETPISGF